MELSVTRLEVAGRNHEKEGKRRRKREEEVSIRYDELGACVK